MWSGRWWCRRNVAGYAHQGLDTRGEQLKGGDRRDLEDVVGLGVELWRRYGL